MDLSTGAPSAGSSVRPFAVGRQERLLLGGIVVAAFVLRVVCIRHTGTIDSEGAEYARIAENLVAGNGYTGLVTPGKNLIFPPLYPFLIALVSSLLGNAELAGRLISVLMGSLLAVPVYLVARDLYGRKVAPFAALLVALHPMLIGFAASVYCESTFMTLQLTGVYLCLRVFRQPSPRLLVLTGAVLGAAYLVRPEAGLYAVLAAGIVGLIALARGEKLLTAGRRALLVVATFAVLALPYVLWLHAQSGQWRMEGKSSLNYATERIMLDRNTDMMDASYNVGPDLVEHGIWLKSHAATLRQVKMPRAELPRYFAQRAQSIVAFLRTTLTSGGMLGAPLIFGLSLLGLFGMPWSRHVAVAQLLIFCILTATGSALFFIYYLSPRYLITFIPFLSIWAAAGIVVFCNWLQDTLQLVTERRSLALPMQALGGLIIIAITLTTIRPAEGLYELQAFDSDARPVREAGEWLDKYAPGEKVVADSQDVLPYHAHASYVPLPYADSTTALRYLKQRHVRYIALHDADNTTRPFLASWLKDGIPSPGVELIYNRSSPARGRILIYRVES